MHKIKQMVLQDAIESWIRRDTRLGEDTLRDVPLLPAIEQQILEVCSGHRWLYLCGEPGTGKTTQAAQVMRAWYYAQAEFVRGFSQKRSNGRLYALPHRIDSHSAVTSGYGAFLNEVEMIDQAKETWSIERFSNAEFLVVDEVGTYQGGEWVKSQYRQLIHARFAQKLPTVFVSNRHIKHLFGDKGVSAVWDLAIKDRMAQMLGPYEDGGRLGCIEFVGQSYRQEVMF